MRTHNSNLELSPEEKRAILVRGAISAAVTLAILVTLFVAGRHFL